MTMCFNKSTINNIKLRKSEANSGVGGELYLLFSTCDEPGLTFTKFIFTLFHMRLTFMLVITVATCKFQNNNKLKQ